MSEFVCCICYSIAGCAVQPHCCSNMFCSACICQWLSGSNTCPNCTAPMLASTLETPNALVQRVTAKWSIHCDFYQTSVVGCPAVIPLASLKQHVAQCQYNPENNPTSTLPPPHIKPNSTANDIVHASPSKLRGALSDRLTAHLVGAKETDGKLEVKASPQGKPKTYTRITVADISSADASRKTTDRRSGEMKNIAWSVCGGDEGATAQEVAGLQRMSKKEQDKLLIEAGIGAKTPEAGTALAIKADLNLPWLKLRKLRRWLKGFNVHLQSEQGIRQFIATKLPAYTAEKIPMVNGQGEVQLTNCVYFLDLVAIVMHYLDWYDAKGLLTWHEGATPDDQIWVKIGGDHGGGMFKFCLQIANVTHPNSITRTIPIIVFSEKDSPANLETAMGRYRQQVTNLLTEQTWHGKSFDVFLFGDYEYQTNMFGLSGARGQRPCLHCLLTRKDIGQPKDQRPAANTVPRNLGQLAHDLEQFQAAGSVHQNAKLSNNVLRAAVLPVLLHNVVIPVLHLDLGIYPWILSAMLTEVKRIDVQLAMQGSTAASDSSAFTTLLSGYKTVQALESSIATKAQELAAAQQLLQFVAIHQTQQLNVQAIAGALQLSCQNLTKQHQELCAERDKLTAELQKKGLKKDFEGPCSQSIEAALKSLNIERQVYFGGAFIGNHIHIALQDDAILKITRAPKAIVEARCPALLADITAITVRYAELFSSYGKCRAHFSHAKAVTVDDIQAMTGHVEDFMSLCRKQVVERGLGNVTPKLHLLKEHTVPMMSRVGVGLGLSAEQGAESIHNVFNRLARDYSSMPNKLERLHSMAKMHLLKTAPDATETRPAVRSRSK